MNSKKVFIKLCARASKWTQTYAPNIQYALFLSLSFKLMYVWSIVYEIKRLFERFFRGLFCIRKNVYFNFQIIST